MPFLRLIRDQRGYETTALLHSVRPGELPRVLYWYRTAPGVRVGRPPLDEDAIRAIEDQHPDIEFDWAQILEVGAAMAADVETHPDRGPQRSNRAGDADRARRKPARVRGPLAAQMPSPPEPGSSPAGPQSASAADAPQEHADQPPAEPSARSGDMLTEFVGREIATRLRARFADLAIRVDQHASDPSTRDAWKARVAALDPDSWITPEQILNGVGSADERFAELRRELSRTAL